MQKIGFYLFLALEKFLMLLPKKIRMKFFLLLGDIGRKLSKKHNKIVEANLKFVYGKDIKDSFIEEVQKHSFRQMALNLLYTMENRYYSVDEITKNVTFENIEVIKKAQKENRPIIFVTAHYGSWELGGNILSALVEPILIIYKKMKNPYFEEYLLSSRAKWKMNYTERHGATRALIKRMREKKATAILIDTNVNKKEAITVNFLDHPTSQIRTTAYLARKFDAALIPILLHTEDNEHFTIKVYDEIIPPKTENEEEDIKISTQMQTDWLSKEILKNPKPWFWLHRRWKDDYPEIYKKL